MNIILFDGICNFCNSSVNFIMARDYKNKFKFAALQSEAGQELTRKLNIDTKKLDSIILIKDNRYYARSSAVILIAKELGFPWNLLYIFIIIPPFIRNISYNIIARYRYKWFGKRESCRVPTAAEREKFL